MFQKSTFYKSTFYKSMFYKSMFYKSTFYKSPFTNPCFTNPPFTNPPFTNQPFTNPLHVLQRNPLQSTPLHSMFYNMPGIHCTFRSDTNHYYQGLVNSKLSFHVYRPRKLKAFEAVGWPPPIARKARADARFIANALLFSFVGNATD